MLHLFKLYKPTQDIRHLLSFFNLGANQGVNPVPSAYLTVRAGHLTQLVPSVSSVHTSCKQRILGFAWFDSNNYVPCIQGNMQTGHIKTVFPFSTSTKCMQTNPTDQLLEEVKAKEYTTLYFNKQLKMIRFFCTLSKVSALMLAVGAPATLLTALMNFISQKDALNILLLIGFYSCVLTSQSFLIMSKIVCKIMASEDDTYLKLSHLTVFGKRRDVYAKVSDILPVSGSLYKKKFHVIRFKGSSKKLILMMDAGGDDTNYEALEMFFAGGGSVIKEDKPQS